MLMPWIPESEAGRLVSRVDRGLRATKAARALLSSSYLEESRVTHDFQEALVSPSAFDHRCLVAGRVMFICRARRASRFPVCTPIICPRPRIRRGHVLGSSDLRMHAVAAHHAGGLIIRVSRSSSHSRGGIGIRLR